MLRRAPYQDLVKALDNSKRPVPKDLRTISQELREKRKAGEKLKNKGSGFGGKGFKFDEAEQKKLRDAADKTRKLLLLQNGEEVSEEEEAAPAVEDDFAEQTANLTAQHAQKVVPVESMDESPKSTESMDGLT